MNGYEYIKALSAKTGRKITDLIVLARQNDPFFCGQPAQIKKAEWFAQIWNQFGYTGMTGIHLRRVHYKIVNWSEPVYLPDGEPYLNTDPCWSILSEAGKYARILNMVDVEAFIDRRNPPPIINAEPLSPPIPAIWFPDDDWIVPKITVDLADKIDIDMPSPFVEGYDYRGCDQPYHVELWIEKSTMNDVLEPVCKRFDINLVYSIGFQSITSAVHIVRRAEQVKLQAAEAIGRAFYSGKPTRIFYISDFDPAGDFMPQAVARQIEYWIEQYSLDLDICLTPLALTREQAIEYQLPRIPIKEKDLRRNNFEAAYGEGATELDALEALHPGQLAHIVESAVAPYRDETLERDLHDVQDTAQDGVEKDWEALIEDEQEQLDDILGRVRQVYRGYTECLGDLKEKMDAELEPLKGELEAVRHAVQLKIDQFEPDLPGRPLPSIPDDEHDWLFDSSRSYLEQLEVYKSRRDET